MRVLSVRHDQDCLQYANHPLADCGQAYQLEAAIDRPVRHRLYQTERQRLIRPCPVAQERVQLRR